VASLSLEEILGYTTLTGLIRTTTTGVPRVLPDAFYNKTQNVLADEGRYTKVTGTRTTARLVAYGAPALNRQLRPIGDVLVKLMHSYEKIMLDPLKLQRLRDYNNYDAQQRGITEVRRQVEEFRTNFENLRTTAFVKTLASGVIYFDSNGNLLPTSSGAFYTVDFGIAANNLNQLNNIITARWDLANTDITAHIRALRKRAARLTGYQPKYAFYGENIPSYFAKNDYAADYLSRNPRLNANWTDTGELPDGLFGLTWVPVYQAFYEDQNGTNQDVWGPDQITFTPDPAVGDWWNVLEGSYQVPTTLNIAGQGAAAYESLKTVYGMFGYGACTIDPPGVAVWYGDTFLGVITNPDAVFIATVIF
jgi:hypothetical protein